MKKVTTFGTALGLLTLGVSAFAQFTSGNLVVSVVRSAANPPANPTSAATRHILREITTSGAASAADVNIYGRATEVTGNNRRANTSGSATSEGYISLSTNGRYIIFVGYDAEIGTTGIAATAVATVNRVIGRYDWALPPTATSLDTSTVITNGYDGNNIRSAASVDGSAFWASGTSTPAGTGGVRYIEYSATPTGTSTQISTTVVNTRVINIFNGQLYVSSATTPNIGLNSVGTGLPTTSGETITNLTTGAGNYDFVFEGEDTVYIADESSAANNGGLQKWVRSGGTFTNTVTYSIPNATATGFVGLRGLTQESSTVFYATTTDTLQRVVKIELINGGASATDRTVNLVLVAATGEFFRDVLLLPSLNNSASGTIAFQVGLENVPLNQPLTIILTPAVGTPITQTVTPDANGNFSTQPVPPGNYRLRVKTAGTLSEATNINLSSGNVSGLTFTLRGGDINNDNATDIGDLLLLIGVYNKRSTDAGFSPTADLNNDGADDIGDLLIIISRYNQLGNN